MLGVLVGVKQSKNMKRLLWMEYRNESETTVRYGNYRTDVSAITSKTRFGRPMSDRNTRHATSGDPTPPIPVGAPDRPPARNARHAKWRSQMRVGVQTNISLPESRLANRIGNNRNDYRRNISRNSDALRPTVMNPYLRPRVRTNWCKGTQRRRLRSREENRKPKTEKKSSTRFIWSFPSCAIGFRARPVVCGRVPVIFDTWFVDHAYACSRGTFTCV